MTGLRQYARDREIPACEGEPEFVPPTPDEACALVAEHLLQPGADAPREARWVYARWKPGVAIASGYELVWADAQETRYVHYKRHAGDKAVELAARADALRPRKDVAAPLAPFVLLPGRRTMLWSYPVDRELPGLWRLHDLRWTSRRLHELGVFPGLSVRSGPSKLVTLRYKPERRAVLRMDLRLRPIGGGERSKARLLARVHPPARARRIVDARASLPVLTLLAPGLVAFDERCGVLFEEYLDLQTHAWNDFSHAESAGRLLAALHAAPFHDGGLELVPAVSGDALLPRCSGRRCWIHGDFHPENVALDRAQDRYRLLDLDELRVGDPAEDLGSWIADRLDVEGGGAWQAAALSLLQGYEQGGGRVPAEEELVAWTARCLARRANASIRRLEHGAVERAGSLRSMAASMEPNGSFLT